MISVDNVTFLRGMWYDVYELARECRCMGGCTYFCVHVCVCLFCTCIGCECVCMMHVCAHVWCITITGGLVPLLVVVRMPHVGRST